jgi:transposase InsO family protein
VFSTVPYYHGERGSQNHESAPSPSFICCHALNSVPRSEVMDWRSWAGRDDRPSTRLSMTGLDCLSGFLSTTANRLTRSTNDHPNQVWCADITYIPMRRGFLYLVAIMDWYSRKVLAWRLSNSMDADFCVEALKEAIAKHGTPKIFNSDQGSQFTSGAWIDVLTDAKIKISMDGKGAWRDNRMIERLW